MNQKRDLWERVNRADIVFTNGCFDLLHAGHVRSLRTCRQLGKYLVVGLNSDASVKRLKGASRPICNQAERQEMLEAVRWVDEVILFEEDTPIDLIQLIRPGVLVKGPGNNQTSIPGANIVRAAGGRVVVLDGPDISTTRIIERIKQS